MAVTIEVYRGAGDWPGAEIREPLLGESLEAALARGRAALDADSPTFQAFVIRQDGRVQEIELTMAPVTKDEREIIKAGCLINYNKARNNK